MGWKIYPNDDRYEVSDQGHVRMIGRTVRKPSTTPSGYQVIVFSHKNSKHTGQYVHRMVMETFIGKCPDGMEVSHLNGKNTDNRLENLCYESRKDNCARKIHHETDYNGSRNPAAKLTELHVREIRASDKTEVFLSDIYNVSRATIGRARRGDSWKTIGARPNSLLPANAKCPRMRIWKKTSSPK